MMNFDTMGPIGKIIFITIVVLNVILFFKIWGMTSNVKEIVKMMKEAKATKSFKYSKGEHVTTVMHKGVMEIIDIYDDGSYYCKDVETDKIVGVFKESELIKK